MDNVPKKIYTEKQWNINGSWDSSRKEILAMASSLGILPKTAVVLFNRGYRDAEAAGKFLNKESELFYDPFLMDGMKEAVARCRLAIERGEKIVIYGDYDVDGVTSVASLYLYLKGRNVQVSYYIPNRVGEGYGINAGALDAFIADGVTLMITVDTGITASE